MKLRVLAFALLFSGCPNNQGFRDASWIHPDVEADVTDRERLEVYITDELTGRGLPCKLTLRGTNGTPDPVWGTDNQRGVWIDQASVALGSNRWVLMGRGRAVIPVDRAGPDGLAPGTYRLTVSRGVEYATIDLGEVTVGPRRGAILRATLRRVIETEGEVAAEFHVHSAPSFDSDVPLDHRVLSLAAEGVEVFASTDHDTSADFAPAIASLGLESYIHWIRGDEITTDGFGHFNAFPIPAEIEPSRDLAHLEPSVAQIVARAREVVPSAMIQLNHPMWNTHPIGYWSLAGFDPSTGRARMDLYTQFDAVEVFNSHTLDEDPRVLATVDSVIDAWMTTIDLGNSATATGNTDTHRLAKTPPGWPRTYLRVATDDPAMITDAMVSSAIRAGDAMVTSGPFLRATVGTTRPGQLARNAGRSVTVSVSLQAPSFVPAQRVEVYANHVMVAARDFDATSMDGVRRQRWEIPLELTRDAWIVVRTRADDPAPFDVAGDHARPLPSLAFTNPIFVDVDNDQRWTPPGPHRGP
ncbi:MAG: CehA/McbA family metallohydrolase [Myxococcales bacterium]|nr:CehA/McbA family metallohydrolase [Myxococcales bacterium]